MSLGVRCQRSVSGGRLWTQLLATPLALIKLYGSGGVCMAWTDFGTVGVVRRAILGRSDKFSEGLRHLRLDPPGLWHRPSCIDAFV